jgi:A/G-specific adenine glycosylase
MSSDPLKRGEKSRITRVRSKLLDWFNADGRSFPWRRPAASEYERICVEVLLQRTRAETVAKIYDPFFERFPDWGTLADAPISDLEHTLKPIGLWRRRAKSISALAHYAAEHDGQFPKDEIELAKVSAVGQYVANAIQLFQHDRPKPLVDVNMARFLERYLRPRRLADIRHDPWLQAACHWLVDCPDPISVNWAVLDHAAITCRARKPLCGACIFLRTCNYSQHAVRDPS